MVKERDPYLDAGMRGWIVNTAKKHYWRVASWYDFEDLVQDGYMCYYRCRARYTQITVKNHPSKGDLKWFMSIVQTAFSRHIVTLASKRTEAADTAISQLTRENETSEAAWDRVAPSQAEESTLASLISSMPAELRKLAEILAGESAEAFQRVRKGRRALRETTNEYYCRLVGLDPEKHDLRGMVRNHFTPST